MSAAGSLSGRVEARSPTHGASTPGLARLDGSRWASRQTDPVPRSEEPTPTSFRAWYFTIPTGDWTGGKQRILYGVEFDPFVADPTQTYTILRLDIDHSNSILGGVSVAGRCTCLERPLCISLGDVYYEDGDGVERTMPLSIEAIHWNDPLNRLSCPLGPDLCNPACGWGQDTTCVVSVPTPAVPSSWGRMKAGYR